MQILKGEISKRYGADYNNNVHIAILSFVMKKAERFMYNSPKKGSPGIFLL